MKHIFRRLSCLLLAMLLVVGLIPPDGICLVIQRRRHRPLPD